jgi:mannose/fructose-specific phosphotransferase system component IIA
MIVGALLVTHGALGEVLVEEACRMVGEQPRLRTLKTEGLDAEAISARVEELVGNEPWLIFTDTPGTSPSMRSRAVLKSGQAVVTGVNLGMLLSFLVHREGRTVAELAKRMVEDGQRSLKVFHGPPEEL